MKSKYLKREFFKISMISLWLIMGIMSGFTANLYHTSANSEKGQIMNFSFPADSNWLIAYFTFEINPEYPLTIFFTDQSTGDVNDWFWEFGDSNTSALQNPTHTYQTGGLYNVCLTVSGDSLNYSDTYCITILVEETQTCTANFTYEVDTAPASVYLVQFNDLSVGDIEIWNWDFGNGNTSNEQNPLHTYNFPGSYNVCLTIMGGDSMNYYNCYDMVCMEIVLGQNNSCIADFTYSIDSSNNNTYPVQFTDQSTGEIEMWFWNFGDGNTSAEQNPYHVYDEPGDYNVCLNIMSSDSSCYDNYCEDITVGGNMGCMADFSYTIDTMPTGPVWVQFIDESVGDIETWLWDFGDGSSGTGQNPLHQYDEPGNYIVCLTIMSGDTMGMYSCYDTYCEEIVISEGNDCMADFNWIADTSNNNGYFVQFTDLSVGEIENWYWNFGDNSTSTEQNPLHQYAEGGTYYVCLTIMGGDSLSGNFCYDTYCEEIVIGQGNECMANFTFIVDSLNPHTVHFFDLSSGNITNWLWEFGDGNSSTEPSPTHTYSKEGTFNVCLSVYDDPQVCNDTYCMEIDIEDPSYYNLGGTVFAGNLPIDEGFAYAYQLEEGQFMDVFASFISQYGYYDFYQIENGGYIVKSELSPNSELYGQFVPTYYGNVYYWPEATLIDLQNNNWAADISLIPVNPNSSGNGAISGMVTYAAKEKANAADVEILLFDDSDQIIGMSFTDDSGSFSFESLGMGYYELLVEITGIHASPVSITLDEENPTHNNINFVVNDQMVTLSVPDGLPHCISFLGDVYPNPVTQKGNIKLVAEANTRVELQLFSITGQIIRHEEYLLDIGENSLQIPVADLKGGFYYVQIHIDGKYALTRKMIKLD